MEEQADGRPEAQPAPSLRQPGHGRRVPPALARVEKERQREREQQRGEHGRRAVARQLPPHTPGEPHRHQTAEGEGKARGECRLAEEGEGAGGEVQRQPGLLVEQMGIEVQGVVLRHEVVPVPDARQPEAENVAPEERRLRLVLPQARSAEPVEEQESGDREDHAKGDLLRETRRADRRSGFRGPHRPSRPPGGRRRGHRGDHQPRDACPPASSREATERVPQASRCRRWNTASIADQLWSPSSRALRACRRCASACRNQSRERSAMSGCLAAGYACLPSPSIPSFCGSGLVPVSSPRLDRAWPAL